MSRNIKIQITLIVIFILAAYLRVDFIRSVGHTMPHDSINYDAMVIQLLEKGIYAYKDTSPNAYVTPGYPLFMAAVYWLVDYQQNDPLPWVRYIQIVLSLLSIGLIYWITRILSNKVAGVMAAFIAAIYPPFVWANGAILTEVLTIFLLLCYLLVQIYTFRHKTVWLALASGLLLGLTVLVRPEFIPLLVMNYLFYWFWKREDRKKIIKLFAVTSVGLVLVLMPWWIRNIVSLDKLVLTATQENPFSAGTYPYKNYDDGLVDTNGKTEMEVAIERLKVGFTTQPWLFLKWYTIGKLQYTYQTVYYGGGHEPFYNVIPFINPNWIHRILIFFGLIPTIAFIRKWKQMSALLVVIIVTMSMIRLGFVPEYRYNVMSMPLIIIINCVFGLKLLRWIIRKFKARSSLVQEQE